MSNSFTPAYLQLPPGELEKRAEQALELLKACVLCPRRCHVNRWEGANGVCRTGRYARVSSYGPHMGEEDVLRGWRGSGTIFFSRCNLRCQFCQNYEISQQEAGDEVDAGKLAEIMLRLQAYGCHNINLVSPTHKDDISLELALFIYSAPCPRPHTQKCTKRGVMEETRQEIADRTGACNHLVGNAMPRSLSSRFLSKTQSDTHAHIQRTPSVYLLEM
jgi:hypothetical protein